MTIQPVSETVTITLSRYSAMVEAIDGARGSLHKVFDEDGLTTDDPDRIERAIGEAFLSLGYADEEGP